MTKCNHKMFIAQHEDISTPKERAFHESGHAVLEFLLGRAHTHLKKIKMGKDRSYVRRRCDDDTAVLLTQQIADDERNQYRRAAICEAIIHLAGPAAQWKFSGEVNEHWFLELFESDVEEVDSDRNRSLMFARKVTRSERRADRLLSFAGRWTDELLAEPRVWRTVCALAESLVDGKAMPDKKAADIMRRAWGDGSEIPLRDLGRKWRRRMLKPRTEI